MIPHGLNEHERQEQIRRYIVHAFYQEGRTQREIAEDTKVSMRTIGRVLKDARDRGDYEQIEHEEPWWDVELPLNDFKPLDYSAPGVRRARGGTRLYPKACPKCGGDVRWHDGTLTCMQCGFERERLVSA